MTRLRQWALLMVLLLGLVGPAWALEDVKPVTLQDAAGATGNGTAIDTASYTSVALQVIISNTATVTFEGTADGSNWVSAVCTSTASTSGTMVTSATASGLYQCNVAGLAKFRARISAWTSGTVTVKGRLTTAMVKKGGGGGSGGAPTDATYLVQTSDGTLSAEQALGSLSTGCLGVTTTTGVVASRTITGTANEITVANGDCSAAPTLSLPSTVVLSGKTVRIPNSTTLPATCTVGDEYMDTDATSGARFYLCESSNTWIAQGTSTGIGGSSGATDNAIIRANGVGGSTVQSSGVTIDDSNNISTPGTITTGSGGGTTGSIALTGATSGGITITPAAASGQTLTLTNAAQTSGAASITIPDLAGVSQTPTFNALAATLTNKTIDAEGTGNVVTLPKRVWFPAAGCNNATAGSVWDLPASNPAVAACITGTNTQKGVLDFADSANLSAQLTYKLPSTWTGNLDANIKWLTTATSGDVVWQLATICVADAETDDPAFNTASTVTDTAKGTTNQTNDAAMTSVTVTGCAAGELMHLKIFRDSANGSDTLAATARLVGVELVMREAL